MTRRIDEEVKKSIFSSFFEFNSTVFFFCERKGGGGEGEEFCRVAFFFFFEEGVNIENISDGRLSFESTTLKGGGFLVFAWKEKGKEQKNETKTK